MHLRVKSALVGVTALVAVCATAFVGSTSAHASSLVVLSQGHVDVLDIGYEDGELAVHVHDETVEPGVEREPSDVLFKVKPEAAVTVPDDPAYSFLGDPGDTVWILPEVENPALLFAGLATEEVEPGALVGDSVRVRLIGVSGPGDFTLFTTDEFGAPDILSDATFTLGAGVHQHANWAFETAGWYWLTFRVTARDAATGDLVSSGPVTFRFKVVA